MQASAINFTVVLGLLLILLLILAGVIFMVCRQSQVDDVFPKSSLVDKQRNSSASIQSLQISSGMDKMDSSSPFPNVPKIIVTTASLREKRI
ncbi:unnamed protein product [Bursaphelenchus xylophilus]|uniref:(pine wood nematode) hypothetical protein n=1 Tax=Bursaphelenchus xylophilus TaxID=6326 RepID=A0A1I7S224_BURXY|nr:unnamed protein product [Bursaphelenchus xylophilus]CAG9090337.1 unnamed protein product [Bursaphelenchus xylophilus]